MGFFAYFVLWSILLQQIFLPCPVLGSNGGSLVEDYSTDAFWVEEGASMTTPKAADYNEMTPAIQNRNCSFQSGAQMQRQRADLPEHTTLEAKGMKSTTDEMINLTIGTEPTTKEDVTISSADPDEFKLPTDDTPTTETKRIESIRKENTIDEVTKSRGSAEFFVKTTATNKDVSSSTEDTSKHKTTTTEAIREKSTTDEVSSTKTIRKTKTTKENIINSNLDHDNNIHPVDDITTHETATIKTIIEAATYNETTTQSETDCPLEPCIENENCQMKDLCKCAPGYTWFEPINESGAKERAMCAAIVENTTNGASNENDENQLSKLSNIIGYCVIFVGLIMLLILLPGKVCSRSNRYSFRRNDHVL